ncbi:MAG: c-type cytochrome [Pseudomonadota bacterium]|nr:c-type cytochrome [Pseudomonadota bacterium]
MSLKNIEFKKSLLVGSLAAVFAIGLAGCSEEKSEPLTSDSGAGVSAPAVDQPSAADVKQPEPVAAPAPVVETAPVVEKAEEVVKEVETKVEEAVAAVTAPASASGASVYGSCVGCHGASGEGGVGPKLAGQTETEIADKLNQYKAGEQVGPMTAMMAPMAQGLSADDITAVSEYIAGF